MKSKHVLNIKHGKKCVCTLRYFVQYTITSCCITGLSYIITIGTVVVVVFFTLTDRASTIPNNTRGCQSGTWSAGQKKIRGTSTKLNEIVLYYHCTVLVARPTEKKVRQTLLLTSAANWSLRRPPRPDRPEALAWCRLLSKCSCRCLCIG